MGAPDLNPLFMSLLAVHIALAIALFFPSFLLPFVLRGRERHRGVRGTPVTSQSLLVRALLWLQAHGSVLVGAGLAVTGAALVGVLGLDVLRQPWLLLALLLYAGNLALAFFVQRPGLARLLGLRRDSTEEELERWRARARRQRYVSYLMAAAVGLIAFLMSTKPSF